MYCVHFPQRVSLTMSPPLCRREANPYEEGVRAPLPWNFYLIYVGSTLYFMSYSLEVWALPF